MIDCLLFFLFFFFNDTATTEIYTLSLHDALPIWPASRQSSHAPRDIGATRRGQRRCPSDSFGNCRYTPRRASRPDRKSTRLNSSHGYISYAVFCLKKKKK